MDKNKIIAVIGLGYVGLPLALEFGKTRTVIGFDIDPVRVSELHFGFDKTKESNKTDFLNAANVSFTNNPTDLSAASIYIVTVPTPIDSNNKPNLRPLIEATKTVGSYISKGNIVIFESTVYPGATEEECVPVLEKISGLVFNSDFFCGYSPERINPGDKSHRLKHVVKITSGSTEDTANEVDELYRSIIPAGTHKTSSIRVAEAAKIIENTQRDVNIALINEFSLIFDKMGIDTNSVLLAAETKWNFLPFKPGLVGGHCIGVDPYYLTHKAETVGHRPQIILSGREINDRMPVYVARKMVQAMIELGVNIATSSVLILGMAFKENCADVRNTKIVDLKLELEKYSITVDIYDPEVSVTDAQAEYGIKLINEPSDSKYDGVILAVPHESFLKNGSKALKRYGKENSLLYDLKSVFPKNESDLRI